MTNNIYTYEIWKKKFKNKFKIEKIKRIFKLYRNKKIFYQAFDINFSDKKNNKYQRFLLIHKRGVQIIPIIFCTTDKKYYTILVKQIRVGVAGETLEFPSGSVEKKENYIDAAKKEVFEELGILLSKRQLKKLSKPVIIQPAFCNLICQFFYFKLKATKEKLKNFNNIKTGVKKDNENCVTVVKKIKNLDKLRDGSILIALKLVENKLNIKS